MRRGFPLSRLVLLALIVPCGSAMAAPPMTPIGVSLAKFEQGKKAYERGKFGEALLAFQASLEVQPSPNTRLYIARCFRALGKTGSAYLYFRLAAREAQDRMTATGERRYKATRDTAAGEAAALEPTVPRLTVTVPSDVPADFGVLLDGKEVPRAAWGTTVEADPGAHELAARAARIKPLTQSFALKPGEQRRIDLRPERLPTATLQLAFSLRPAGMAVSVDGQPLPPERQTEPQEVDAGRHEVVVQAPGYLTFRWRRTLPDGEVARVPVQVRIAHGTPRAAFFTVAAVALAGLAAGTGCLVYGNNTQDAQLMLDPSMRDPAVRDQVHTLGIAGTASLAVGGALALTAGVLAFTTRWRDGAEASEHRTRVGFAPWLSPGAGGVAITIGGQP